MNTTIQTRIDKERKKQAEAIFNSMGITLNDGIRLFLNQVIFECGLPFQPKTGYIPNKETEMAIKEVETGNHSVPFKSVDELFEDLKA